MDTNVLLKCGPTIGGTCMRVALVSDVHTNIEAWDTLTRHLEGVAPDQVWSLGDWLGYQDHFPLALWDRIRISRLPPLQLLENPDQWAVIGNHDLAVLNGSVQGLFNDEARRAIMRQRQAVENARDWQTEFAPWLQRHPYMLSPLRGVYLAHGVFYPDNPEFIPRWYPGRDVTHEQSFRKLSRWLANGSINNSDKLVALEGWYAPLILITGHTHHQGVWQRPPQPRPSEDWPLADSAQIPEERARECARNCAELRHVVRVSPSDSRPVWINPGSVGLQRDRLTQPPRCEEESQWVRYAVLEWDPAAQPIEATIYLYWLPVLAA